MPEIEASDEDIKKIVERVIIAEDEKLGTSLHGINNEIEDIIKDEISRDG